VAYERPSTSPSSSFWSFLGGNPSSNGTGTLFTKEITIIGWIDGTAIKLPDTSSANPFLLAALSSDPIPDANSPCATALLAFRLGNRTLITNEIDRQYANAFLIASSANHEPPSAIGDSVFRGGDYRAYNRVQAVLEPSGNEILKAQFYNSKAALGNTPDACHSPLSTVANFFVGGGLFKPEPHPDNGKRGVTQDRLHAFQLAEGRVGPEAQAVNMTLNACFSIDTSTGLCNSPVPPATPYIWSYPLIDYRGAYTVKTQIFPTYYVYENGRLVDKTSFVQQAVEDFIKLNSDSQMKATDIK
ncbi:MAG: hypothetical protein ACRD4I_12795, partial [Candidatus Angelobacter sp.]